MGAKAHPGVRSVPRGARERVAQRGALPILGPRAARYLNPGDS